MAVFTVTSRIDPTELVPCPTCKQGAPWRCRTRSYRATKPHVARRQAFNALTETEREALFTVTEETE